MPDEFLRPILFIVGMMVSGVLGYIQGRKDEKLSWLLLLHKPKAQPVPPSSRPTVERYCPKHEHWFKDHCPDCTMPSERS